MSPKEASMDKGISVMAMIKSAFPLLAGAQTPNSASLASCAQILLATSIAYRCYPTISTRDILFCVFYPTYLLLANRLRFADNLLIRQRPEDHPHNISAVMFEFFSGTNSKWFQKYVAMAGMIGLLLPFITIIYAPTEVSALAVPHLFLLWCQIIGETLTMFNPRVHRFVTLLLPLGFSVYRMNSLVDWFLESLTLFEDALALNNVSGMHIWGLFLAGLNLVMWTYNLFLVLLLRITTEFLANDRCESPDVQVVSLPFIKESKKETK